MSWRVSPQELRNGGPGPGRYGMVAGRACHSVCVSRLTMLSRTGEASASQRGQPSERPEGRTDTG